MNSNLGKLNLKDIGRGAISAIFVGCLMALMGVVSNGFDIFTADWGGILQNMLNGGFVSFIGYLGTQLLSDHEGKVLGRL